MEPANLETRPMHLGVEMFRGWIPKYKAQSLGSTNLEIFHLPVLAGLYSNYVLHAYDVSPQLFNRRRFAYVKAALGIAISEKTVHCSNISTSIVTISLRTSSQELWLMSTEIPDEQSF